MDETASNDQSVDISKDPELIKDSQRDIGRIDVLVCGTCYETYHFIEEFQQHKSSNDCKRTDTVVHCENETKPQVWAFTLWKNKQMKILKEKNEDIPSSWDIYQKWIKLQQDEKNVWIVAGKNLQDFNKIATSKIEAVPIIEEAKKIEKDPLALDDEVIDNSTVTLTNDAVKSGIIKPLSSKVVAGLAEEAKKALRTAGESGKEEFNVEKIIGKRFNPKKRLWEYHVKWENYKDPTWEPLAHLENCKDLINEYEDKIKAEKEKEKAAQSSGRGRGRPKLNQSNTPGKNVEKKTTPVSSPNTVIITTPGGRPQRTSKQKALNQVKQWCGNISDTDEPSYKRPFDDGDDSDDSFEKKIKLEADSADSDDEERTLQVKKSPKLLQYNNNGVGKKLPENVLIPDAKGVVRISQKQLPSLSSGVYIMSRSSGIIKLDPAASKIATSGGGQAIVKVGPKIGQTQIKIIKKDDTTNKTTIVQMKAEKPVSPKTTRLVQQVVKSSQIQQQQQQQQQQKKDNEKSLKKNDSKLSTSKKEEPKSDDDSDYGLEELEFPTDIPIPEPDSPPGEFVLDPITGKIAGQEYPEPKPQADPETEVEPIVSESKDTDTPTDTIDNIVKLAAADITEEDLRPDEPTPVPTTTTLTDAIVTTTPVSVINTTAANTVAQITPETSLITSLQQEQQQPQAIAKTTTTTTTTVVVPTQQAAVSTKLPTTVVKAIPVVTTAAVAASTSVAAKATVIQKETQKATQSILNTALANSNILQKTLLSPVSRTKVVPKIINQTVATKPRTSLSPIVRNVTTVATPKHSNLVRPRPSTSLPPKPKFNISSSSSSSSSIHSNVNRNVYSRQPQQQNNIVKKVGPTNVYSKTKTYSSPAQLRQQPQQQQKTLKTQAQIVQQHQQPVVQQQPQKQQPKAVISMPSLSVDEEPTTVTVTQPQQQQQQQATVAEETTIVSTDGDLSTTLALAAAGGDRQMFITGDDGTVYEVAGQNEHGQTILITQDSDGQQQCLLVTNDAIETETPQQSQEQQQQQPQEQQVMMEVQEQQPEEMTEEQPVVAQLIRTEPPSPGGTHKVVVMLPTGEMMVTEMSQEEYANLELDK